MSQIQIFALEFSGTRFACSRDFTGAYHLQAGGFALPMASDTARALAEGGGRIRLRAQVAAHFGRELKSGATFRRDLLAVDSRAVHVEIEVADAGNGIYIEIATARMTLTDQQAQLLLAVLDQLGADVTAVNRAAEVPQQLTVAQGLRGWLYDWDRDPTW